MALEKKSYDKKEQDIFCCEAENIEECLIQKRSFREQRKKFGSMSKTPVGKK